MQDLLLTVVYFMTSTDLEDEKRGEDMHMKVIADCSHHTAVDSANLQQEKTFWRNLDATK